MTTAAKPLTLPDVLREHTADITKALATPLLMTWDENAKFANADQPAAIGRVLVEAIHTHLGSKKVGYLFREDMTGGREIVLGKATRVGSKLAYYSELDFLIEINWKHWLQLDAHQRVALIDHELTHCTIEETEHGERTSIVGHDVEEFSSILARWGLWEPGVEGFAKTLRQTQHDFFEQGRD